MTHGAKPYIRVYVNTDDIWATAVRCIEERKPEITRFEASCTSDPLSIEHITGSLYDLIERMADQPFGKLRSVIEKRYPKSKLQMNIAERKYKWGRWGQGKYVYPDERANRLKEFITGRIGEYFPASRVLNFT
ncbi:hypothetical protein J6TS7_22340 [Paenibacillus dendritiformis]|nr:hypothetical protein J6TS7_22340 [Paenibacillus dendritiformis]